MAEDDKPTVQVEAEEVPEPQVQAPYGMQDMNAPMEPPDLGLDGGPITRVLTSEVHVDMGRGALTFRPGDKLTIEDGHIRNVVTQEGMEYDFKPAHEAYAEQRAAEVDAQLQHQNLSAGQVKVQASQAPRTLRQTQPGTMGEVVDTETAHEQPGRVIGPGGVDPIDVTPVTLEELPISNPIEDEPPPPENGATTTDAEPDPEPDDTDERD